MKCANCGFVMPGGAKYCPACGHEVCNAEYQSDDYIQGKDEDFEKKSDYLPIKNTVTYKKLCLAAGLVVFAAGILASILGKWLCTVVCCVQAAGPAYGFLVHKRLLSGHPRQRKYISAAVSFGLSAVYISLFVFTGSGLYEKGAGDTFVLPAPARVQPAAIKGYEYIWVADRYTLYTANVLSDTSVKIQKYKRDEPGRCAEYAGQTIEFDGRIDYCTKHGNYNTRFDYLVSAEDYDPDSQTGPSFKFENVNYYDLNTDLDTVSVGLNVKITAQVVRYDTGSGLFYLKPISVKSR